MYILLLCQIHKASSNLHKVAFQRNIFVFIYIYNSINIELIAVFKAKIVFIF